MKHKNIKEMNKEQRLNYLTILFKAYNRLMLFDIYSGNQEGAAYWQRDAKNALRIIRNIYKMRDIEFNSLLLFLK